MPRLNAQQQKSKSAAPRLQGLKYPGAMNMDIRNNDDIHNIISRRRFLAATAAAGAVVMIGRHALAADDAPASAGARPNSVFGGVAIGTNTYSYRGGDVNTAEETLKALLEDGLS
jgi:hypothetical protein